MYIENILLIKRTRTYVQIKEKGKKENNQSKIPRNKNKVGESRYSIDKRQKTFALIPNFEY